MCYQIAYAGLQLGRLQQTDGRYIMLNILGPGCLLFSLLFYFNLASFVTQVLWISLTTIGFVRIILSRRKGGQGSDANTASKCTPAARTIRNRRLPAPQRHRRHRRATNKRTR